MYASRRQSVPNWNSFPSMRMIRAMPRNSIITPKLRLRFALCGRVSSSPSSDPRGSGLGTAREAFGSTELVVRRCFEVLCATSRERTRTCSFTL